MSDKIKDGGQAFPSSEYHGMTLRDWFAGQALAGLFADAPLNPDVLWSDVSRAAYEVADAMIAERGKA
jgi:hypothetical protein